MSEAKAIKSTIGELEPGERIRFPSGVVYTYERTVKGPRKLGPVMKFKATAKLTGRMWDKEITWDGGKCHCGHPIGYDDPFYKCRGQHGPAIHARCA